MDPDHFRRLQELGGSYTGPKSDLVIIDECHQSMIETPVNDTIRNIPAFFDPCGENTYIQKFDKMVDSRKFAQKMRALCGDAVKITDDNGSVRMHILVAL